MAEKAPSTLQLSDLICCSADLEHYLCEFILSGGREITILLSGKTGVGKSHLTNALIGEELAEEGEELDPQTDDVTPYDFIKNNVKITVFDTPGLADGTGNDEKYLSQIIKKVTAVDLFLFCTDMTSTRFRDDDAKTISKLTKTFGKNLWDHALVVLTFANKVQTTSSKEIVSEKYFFQKRIHRFQKKICEMLVKEEVEDEALSDLPFVPAGECKTPKLPDRDNWLTVFWIEAFKRINRNAKAAFLLANIDRITISYGGFLSDFPSETRQGESERDEESSNEETFWIEGCLERSSPVISTSAGEGKYYRKVLQRIKSKRLTLTTEDSSDSDTSCKDDHGNETIKGSLRRRSPLVSADDKERFRRRMQRKRFQGLRDEKDSQEKYFNTRYKCENSFDYDFNDGCDDDDDVSQFARLSFAELATEKQTHSPQLCEKLYSLPPSYDEVVRNPVPLPMDDCSSQELFKEMVREALNNSNTGEYAGAALGQSGFGKIYAKLFRKIMEFVKNLLRGKENSKTEK